MHEISVILKLVKEEVSQGLTFGLKYSYFKS